MELSIYETLKLLSYFYLNYGYREKQIVLPMDIPQTVKLSSTKTLKKRLKLSSNQDGV